MEGCYLGILFGLGLLFAGSPANCDESLRGAIEAFQRRQRDLEPRTYLPRSLFLDDGQPEDIGYGYQKNIPPLGLYEQPDGPYDFDDRSDIRNQEKLILDYLDQESNEIPLDLSRYPVKKSIFREREDAEPKGRDAYDEDTPLFISSPFRERLAYKDKGHRNIIPFIRNMEKAIEESYDENQDDDNEYLSMIESIWEKYKGEREENEVSQEDLEEMLKYMNLKDDKKRQMDGAYGGYDFFNTPFVWAKRSFPDFAYSTKRNPYQAFAFDERYPYSPIQKRFPITKRSPVYSARIKKNTQTDPKVAEELNNIFSSNKRTENKTNESPKANQTVQKPGQKEQTDTPQESTKKLDIKKKSIDWSNYFGIDRRRKKSFRARTPEDEWLVNHYLGSYFPQKDEDNDLRRKGEEMDDRLKGLEDMVLDQAIKFTGAHEGETDPEVTQEVKNRVLSQLAAAYSLEKMRQALSELKPSYLAQKASAPSTTESEPKETSSSEPKVEEKKEEATEPLKEVEDEEEEKKKKKSYENVKVPGKPGSCRILRELEVRCNEACHIAGDRLGVFQRLCIYHEICTHCGFDGGPSISPRACDVYFLENAKNACEDTPVCTYTGRQMLMALRGLRPLPTCDARDHSCLASFLSQ